MNHYSVLERMPGTKFFVLNQNLSKEEAERIVEELHSNPINFSTYEVVDEKDFVHPSLQGAVAYTNVINGHV